MSYCTIADVRSRNSLLLSSSDIEDSIIEEQIEYAEGIVNGYVAVLYTLPLTTVSPIIKGISADLAGALCIGIVLGNTGDNPTANQALELKNSAMELLAQIRKGEILLTRNDGSSTNTSSPQIYAGRPRRLEFEHWDPMFPRNPRPRRRHG